MRKKIFIGMIILVVIAIGLLGFIVIKERNSKENIIEGSDNNAVKEEEEVPLEVHYIDVGKGDSILVKQGNNAMLIDAGYSKNGEDIEKYLKDNGVLKLNVVVATHPDKDHIGGMSYIVDNFNIGSFYMTNATKDSKQYANLMSSIENSGLQITVPKVGNTFFLGEAKCTIVAPASENYEDVNDSSIVIKLQYKDTSFLFCGDAKDVSQKEMMNSNMDLKSTVIKIPHHGSEISTAEEFLITVNPEYAVISTSDGEEKQLPKLSLMNILKKKNITVYRTDENGTVVVKSDGSNLTFNTKAGSYNGY